MEHFIHPGHRLAEVYGSEEFYCDGCKTPGKGPRYRCHPCDFNMHDYCGRCLPTLSTFMHPQHRLQLVFGPQDGRGSNQGFCDLCGDNVKGMFYRCKLCDFDIHPLCTKLPENIPHALHPDHRLQLHKSSAGPGWCRVCRTECTSWRYGCTTCSFDIHLECILARCCDADRSMTSRSVGSETPVLPRGWGLYPPYDLYGQQSVYYSSTPAPYNQWPHFGGYVHPLPNHHSAAYADPYAFAPPPSPPPPIYPTAYVHEVHSSLSPYGANQFVGEAHEESSSGSSKWAKMLGKVMFALVTNLAAGLLAGVIFGL